jgi:hypothetical protein
MPKANNKALGNREARRRVDAGISKYHEHKGTKIKQHMEPKTPHDVGAEMLAQALPMVFGSHRRHQ